jgi:hypothetical protein
MTSSARFVGALLLVTACAASLPSAKVVANMRGGDFAPITANAGFVVSGNPLTVWRPQQLQSRRSVNEHPGAIAIADGGQAFATVAAPPGLGLRSYRLPGLELIQAVGDACNDMVSISLNSALVACAERREVDAKLQTNIHVFSFPKLEPVQSWGPVLESVESMSFVGSKGERLAIAVTFVEPPNHPDNYRSRLELFDTRSGKVIGDFSRPGRFSLLTFEPQGDIFVWAGQSGAESWSVRSLAPLKTFGATAHTIAAALSPDARLLATSHAEHTISDKLSEGGGTIQIFDTQSSERLASFGSAELRDATSPHDSDQMLNERARVEVKFELLGSASVGDGHPAFGDMFGSPQYVANHQTLAFLDNDTLLSAGRGFFALWTLNQEAIRKARANAR